MQNEDYKRLMTLPENFGFDEDYKGSVYRFFGDKAYADAFAQGEIYLSTLETCRAYEDAEQGDAEEGHQDYIAKHLEGNVSDPAFSARLKEVGAGRLASGNVTVIMKDTVVQTRIPDAYVICTTTEFSPEELSTTFGAYCVEITDPKRFFLTLSKKIEEGSNIQTACAGRVQYRDRSFSGDEPPPGTMGFVKPVEPYSKQKEYRFLWVPKNYNKLEPIVIKCAEVSKLCKRIL